MGNLRAAFGRRGRLLGRRDYCWYSHGRGGRRGERAIHSTHAAVYNFDTETNSWTSTDGGVSRVFIFSNPQAATFRVIGISGEEKVLASYSILTAHFLAYS